MTHSITPIIEGSFFHSTLRGVVEAEKEHGLIFEPALRFYHGFCEPYLYEPTKDKFQVISTAGKGEALIALKYFEVGEIVFIFNGTLMNEQTLFTLQVAEGQYIEDPFVMGKVLHACDPNMVADMQTLTFRATKPIQPNDLLTMDYETTEDELYRQFHCQCKASNCRGHIQGRKWVK